MLRENDIYLFSGHFNLISSIKWNFVNNYKLMSPLNIENKYADIMDIFSL